MKKSILLALIIGLAAVPVASATTVGFGAIPTARSVVNDTGTSIAAGSLWWVGNFANENFSLGGGTIATNWAAISTAGGWVALGTESGTASAGNGDGRSSTIAGNQKIGGTLTDNSGAAAALNGKAVYLVLFNAASLVTATEIGIFKSTAGGGTPAWVFPTDLQGNPGDSVTLSSTSAPTIVPVGTTPIGSSATAGQLTLASVPEPSTALLSGLGLMAMAARRRRN